MLVTDCFTPEKRSWVMRQIKGKDTKPEVILRQELHRMGYRFRLHRADLPGKPDIVLPKYRVAIYVNGCFWHGHSCQKGRRPKSNSEYWDAKLQRNRDRDKRIARECRELKWNRIVVWECELKRPEHAARRIAQRIDGRKP